MAETLKCGQILVSGLRKGQKCNNKGIRCSDGNIYCRKHKKEDVPRCDHILSRGERGGEKCYKPALNLINDDKHYCHKHIKSHRLCNTIDNFFSTHYRQK